MLTSTIFTCPSFSSELAKATTPSAVTIGPEVTVGVGEGVGVTEGVGVAVALGLADALAVATATFAPCFQIYFPLDLTTV